jgi:hypothetical protein
LAAWILWSCTQGEFRVESGCPPTDPQETKRVPPIAPELQPRGLTYESHHIHSNHSEYNSSIRDRILTVRGNWQPGYSGPAHKVNFGLTQVDAYLNEYILQQIPKKPSEYRQLLQNYNQGASPRPILNPEYNSSIRDRILTVRGNWQPGYSGPAHKVPKKPSEYRQLLQNYNQGASPTNHIISTATTLNPKWI